MTDMFTVTAEYDRDEIYADAKKFVDAGSTMPLARDYLNTMYPAWSLDKRTSIIVDLMFRSEGDADMFHDLLTRKLAELNEKEGVTA